ncbi:hypothetical protein HRG_009675 [Hirsutella rhossiliensis]|uniref:DUF5672 domain-containing protein n=1 Tax=Hirsutella rhossiliensis TaxID=111463 RepID=A0A9P8MQB3_9HYPO|nr:uncharacterized protein HRG_09675 [Hirsutella rhossiliensis]KAH0959214.1 hypothetical protein HRG_09675 [Hirsutella rhossiliensis]
MALSPVAKTRACIVASIILTWWVASLLPRFKPAATSQVAAPWRSFPSIKAKWGNHDTPYNASKLAVIIDPEPNPLLVPLILHMMAVVPPDWRFLFIGSKASVLAVGRGFGIQVQQAFGRIDLKEVPKPWSIEDDHHRSALWTDLRFYNDVIPGVEWILKFDRDSILCSNSETSLNDWLDWSWAGAARSDDGFSGHGGLSLRRVSVIKRVLEFQKWFDDSEPEDDWFAKRLKLLPDIKALSGSERAFAVENKLVDKPMGYYARDRGRGLDKEVWKMPETRQKIFDYCPELRYIMDMKLEQERCPEDNKQDKPPGKDQA